MPRFSAKPGCTAPCGGNLRMNCRESIREHLLVNKMKHWQLRLNCRCGVFVSSPFGSFAIRLWEREPSAWVHTTEMANREVESQGIVRQRDMAEAAAILLRVLPSRTQARRRGSKHDRRSIVAVVTANPPGYQGCRSCQCGSCPVQGIGDSSSRESS